MTRSPLHAIIELLFKLGVQYHTVQVMFTVLKLRTREVLHKLTRYDRHVKLHVLIWDILGPLFTFDTTGFDFFAISSRIERSRKKKLNYRNCIIIYITRMLFTRCNAGPNLILRIWRLASCLEYSWIPQIVYTF